MPRQQTFAAGELSPRLQARSDVERFDAGLATCRNFIPTPAGPIERRTGSAVVATAKAGKPRFIPFIFANNQSFVLEVGAGYIRFIHAGAQVMSLGAPYELSNPWTEAQVWRLKYSQVGDTIVFTHPECPPHSLSRVTNTSWTLTEVSFDAAAAFFFGGSPRIIAPGPNIDSWPEDLGHYAQEWQWGITTIFEDVASGLRWESRAQVVTEYRQAGWPLWSDTDRYVGASAPLWSLVDTYALHAGVRHGGSFYYSLQAGNVGHAPGAVGSETWWKLSTHRVSVDPVTGAYWQAKGISSFTLSSSGNAHPWDDAADAEVFWEGPFHDWQTGDAEYIAAKTINSPAPAKIVLAPDRPVKLVWPPPALPSESDYRVLGFRVYRGQGGTLGWVGDTELDQAEPDAWHRLKTYAAGDLVTNLGSVFIALQPSGPNASLDGSNVGAKEPSTVEEFAPADPDTGVVDYLNPYWRQTDYPLRFFVDRGQAPDITHNPPRGNNPFTRYKSDGTVDYTESPAVVSHFGGRRVYANTYDPSGEKGRPAAIVASRLNDFANFQRSEIPVADDALDLVLASEDYQEIRNLVPMRRLVVLTSRGEWVLGGAGGAPLSALSIDALQDSTHGCSWLNALRIGDAVLFCSEEGWAVRDLLFSQDAQGYKSRDLTLWSAHLFEGRRIVDWAWARTPHSVVWAVRDDGILLSCTYLEEQGVSGWAWHDTDGAFEGVCVVPEMVTIPAQQLPAGAYNVGHVRDSAVPSVQIVESAVYVLVSRGGVRTIERLASSRFTDVREGVYLDAAYGVDGRNVASAATVTLQPATGWDVDDHVEALASAATLALPAWPPTVGDHLVLGPDTSAPVRVRVDSSDDPSTLLCTVLDDAVPLEYRDAPTAAWGIGVQTVQAPALAGRTVNSLEDGVPHASIVVKGSGEAAFSAPTVVGRVGLGYVSDAELLDLAPQEVRTKTKTVSEVSFEVLHSKGLEAGETFEKLTAARAKPVSFRGYQGDTGLVEVRIANTWNKGGRACVRQSNPLPLTIIAASRKVALGED